jgi:hypothetical protein
MMAAAAIDKLHSMVVLCSSTFWYALAAMQLTWPGRSAVSVL